jgi:Ca2+/H+ antiporter
MEESNLEQNQDEQINKRASKNRSLVIITAVFIVLAVGYFFQITEILPEDRYGLGMTSVFLVIIFSLALLFRFIKRKKILLEVVEESNFLRNDTRKFNINRVVFLVAMVLRPLLAVYLIYFLYSAITFRWDG